MLIQHRKDFMHEFAVYDILEGNTLLWTVVNILYFGQNEVKLVISEFKVIDLGLEKGLE